MREVHFCSREEFINRKSEFDETQFLISISDTDEEVNEVASILILEGLNPSQYLLLRFQDDDVSFTEKEAENIISRLDEACDEGLTQVLVHCFVGVSRSAAVAKFINDFYIGSGNPFYENYKVHNKLVYSTLEKVYNRVKLGLTNSWDD